MGLVDDLDKVPLPFVHPRLPAPDFGVLTRHRAAMTCQQKVGVAFQNLTRHVGVAGDRRAVLRNERVNVVALFTE